MAKMISGLLVLHRQFSRWYTKLDVALTFCFSHILDCNSLKVDKFDMTKKCGKVLFILMAKPTKDVS